MNYNINNNSLSTKSFSNVSCVLNLFQSNDLIKLTKLYYFIFFLTGQRPFLKKVRFKNLKKKILKRFFFGLTLRRNLLINFLRYLKFFYFYYYQIYYTKKFNYNYNAKKMEYRLFNPYAFYKSYNKLNFSFCLVVSHNKFNNNSFFKSH